MRKMYLLLSLALLLCGVNDAWGRLRKKDPQPTELGIDSPRDGMMIAFNRIAQNSSGSEANLWLCAGGEDNTMLSLLSATEPTEDITGWILEASDEVIEDGIQSFYLRNFATGKYLTYVEGSDDPEANDAVLSLNEKAAAKSFIIVPTKQGAVLMGTSQTNFGNFGGMLKDGDWMLISKQGGKNRNINTRLGLNRQGFMSVYSNYATWHTAYEVEEYTSAIADLRDLLTVMPELNVKGGTNPGCYPQELIDEYAEARNAVYALAQQAEEPARDIADAAMERLRNADAAIKAGRIPLTTGYYRIVNASPKFEQIQGVRYAMTVVKDVPAWRAFGATGANELWHIVVKNNNVVTVRNVGNTEYIVGHNAMNEKAEGELTITFIDKVSYAHINYNDGGDFHANQHSNGYGTGGDIALWSHTNTYDGVYSTWFIEAVTDEELAQYEDKICMLEFKDLLFEATEKYNGIAVYGKVGDGLITTVGQLSSNADHNALCTYQDGDGLSALIDGDVHTYFHSLWQSTEGAPDAYHNLTVDLKTTLNKFAFTMAPRYQSWMITRPTEIVLYGAVAGADTSRADSWKKLQTITGLPDSQDRLDNDEELTFISPGYLLNNDYQYLRFEVTKTNYGRTISVNGHAYPFFTMSEFQIYNVELEPNCPLVTLGEEVAKAFEEAYKKALSIETPTQQDIDDLRQAIYDFENARKVDLRISNAGFATLMLPYDAALPEGVKAYSTSQAAEVTADGCRVLKLVEEDALQANTPYIIEGAPGTYTFSGIMTNTQDTYTNGWLTGTFVARQAQAGTYVLQNNNGITGFYRVATGKEPHVGANRAWLSVPTEEGATAEVTAFVFGDDSATGIEGVDAADRQVDVYTLEGVCVRTNVRMSEALKALPRGVYVVNGKKTVK